MMSEIKYTNIDRIFARLGRDLKGTDLNESDVIEWIGEALDFLKVPQILEAKVKFLDVIDYHAEMPADLHLITQIARNNNYEKVYSESECILDDEIDVDIAEEVLPEVVVTCDDLPVDCNPDTVDLDWTYGNWIMSERYQREFSPVRLATGTFFNSLVCKEKESGLYSTCTDEYTIVGRTEKRLRFNFIEGQVAVACLVNATDPDTGYPLIPDQISYITAIVYYVKWKMAEMYEWAGRDGWAGMADKSEAKWIKYSRQAKNYMKMPKTLDEYQNLLEQSHYLIPNHKRYYGYFGNLGKRQTRNFMNYNKEY